MAGDSKPPGQNLGGNAFVWVAVVAAAVAYVGNRSNLENLRPRVKEPSIPAEWKQDVDARLWQDPFETVLEAEGARYQWSPAGELRGSPTPQASDPESDLHYRSPLTDDDSSAEVIGITVAGGPYSEDIEFRRRTRYAVLAALHVLGYSPRDPEHIGVYIPPQPKAPSLKDIDTPSNASGLRFVPYEFLTSPAGHPLLLLWLDEGALASNPLQKLARFFCWLGSGSISGSRVAILGPEGSDTLLAMAEDADGWNTAWNACESQIHDGSGVAAPSKPSARVPSTSVSRASASSGSALSTSVHAPLQPPTLALYDYSATADPTGLCRQARHGECVPGDWVAAQFEDKQNNIELFRATATDDVLASAIKAELDRRGIHPGVQGAHVALISELDTLYGRSLPETVARCLMSSATDGSCNENGEDGVVGEETGQWLTRYSYLRGLDGQTADSSSNDLKADSSTATETARGRKSGGAEDAESSPDAARDLLSKNAQGEEQGDYLVRLSARLRNEDARLRNRGGEGIRAVGILGSDVYDKLLVFEAVKSALPHALFFTTDLDERLVRPSRDISTVDLIVASGLGLSLRHGLQQDIPPFRGAYQTAAFLATLMAACAQCTPLASTGAASRDEPIAPAWFRGALTYEIGRTRPILLRTAGDPPRNDCADGSSPPDVFVCNAVTPSYRPSRSWVWQVLGLYLLEAGTAAGLSALLLRFALGRPLSPGFGQRRSLESRRRWMNVARWLIPALFAAAVLGFQCWDRGLLEHTDLVLLFEGVSLWPAICIQLLSVAFGIAVIFHVGRSSKANLRRIRSLLCMKRVMVDLEKSRPNVEFQWRRTVPLGVRRWRGTGGAGDDPEKPTGEQADRTKQFWVRYVDYARHGVQFCRVSVLTIAGMLVAWAVHLVFPSPPPAVSAATGDLYTGVTLANAVTTLAVAIYIADITLFSRLFVREAFARDSRPPLWLVAAKQEFAKRRLRTQFKLDDDDDTQDALVTITMTLAYVSERTKNITPFIYYPFIMIALSVISRSPLLGPSGFGPWSITVEAMSLLVAFLSAIALRSAAEDARSQTIRNLNIVKWQALTPGPQTELGGRLDVLLQYVSNLRDGAFSPLSQQPFVRALLLPLASYGGTLLMSLLSITS